MRTFRTGFGRLTAPMLNGMVAAAAANTQSGGTLRKAASTYDESARRTRFIYAKITGATLLSGATNRWEYAWEEIELTTAGGFQTRTGGLTSTAKGKALNLCEAFNNGTGLEGPGWSLTTAPTGFEIKPIGQSVVQLWLMRGPGGAKRYVFSLANVLDGECP